VVVRDLDVARVPTRPTEANPPLIIYPNAVLPRASSLEALQPISGRDSQVLNSLRRVQKQKLAKRLALNVLAPLCDADSIEYSSCFCVRERSDHDRERVPDCVTNATRYYVSPYNNLLHLTGRLTSPERPSAPVAEEPLESFVPTGDERYALDSPLLAMPAGYGYLRYAACTWHFTTSLLLS